MNKRTVEAIGTIKALSEEHAAEVRKLRRSLDRALKQRDEWKGRANELKSYVTKYQAELVAAQRFIAELKHPT